MDRSSEVILRNTGRLADGSILLINPPRDSLFRALPGTSQGLRVFTQHVGDHQWFLAAGADSTFGLLPPVTEDDRTVILWLPREKQRLEMLAHAAGAAMGVSANLWVIGENRAGIKSAARRLKPYFNRVDSA